MRDRTDNPHQGTGFGADLRENADTATNPEAFRALFASAGIGAARVSLEGLLLDTNPALSRMLGYSREELVGLHPETISHPDEMPLDEARFSSLSSGDIKHYQLDKRYIRKDGSVFWGRLEIWPVFDGDGAPVEMIAVVQDASEFKRTEQGYLESERRYRTLVEESPWNVSVVQDGHYVYLNPATRKTLGIEPETDPRHVQLMETIAPEYRDMVRERIAANLDGTANRDVEMRVRRPDGTMVDIVSTSLPIEYDGRAASLVVGVDVTEAKKARQQLERERARFYRLLDLLPAYVRLQDANYRVRFVNGRFRELFGEPGDKCCYEAMYGQETPCEDCSTQEVFKTGSSCAWEWTDASGRCFQVYVAPFPAEQGEPMALVVGMEITERKNAERALAQAEKEKATVLGAMTEMVAFLDTGHRIIWANQAAGESVGATAEALVGRLCHRIWHDSDTPCEGCPVERCLVSGTLEEGHILTPDGRVFMIRANPVMDEKERIVGVVEFGMDVTQRYQAEEALRESEDKYRKLVENACEGIAVVQNGQLRFVNPYCSELLGSDVAALAGASFRDFIHPSDRGVADFPDGSAWRRLPDHANQEIRILPKTGEMKWVQVRGVPIEWVGQSATLYFLTDITERRRMSEELQAAHVELETRVEGRTRELKDTTQRLKREIEERKLLEQHLIRSERLAATGQLAASVAHEINSPLQAVSVLLDTMGKSSPTDSGMLESVELLQGAFSSIKTTVNNLLDLNRPGSEDFQYVDLNLIVKKTASLTASLLRKSGITMELAIDPGPVGAHGSPRQINQVLLNLVNNSVEALGNRTLSEDGDGGRSAPGLIRISTYTEKDNAVLVVLDNGPGIPPEDLHRVFDPSHTTKKAMGMGVGLSVCHDIIQAHDGRIVASNMPGGGARFQVFLPRRLR
ncbi:MAG: PAS domain S-box protein [Desulfatibacillaceae bacterium]